MLVESGLLKHASRIRRDCESTRLHTFANFLPTILGSASRVGIEIRNTLSSLCESSFEAETTESEILKSATSRLVKRAKQTTQPF